MKERLFVGESNRAEQLQFMRFCAFTFVFIRHVSWWTWNISFDEEVGYCAVSFFFMLSGFVLAYSSFDRKIDLSFSTCKRHFWKKIKKVYPLYFATTIFAVLLSEIPELIFERDLSNLKLQAIQLVKNLLLIQSWFKEGFFSFNGVGWYLSTLLFIGLLDIPLVYLCNKIKDKKRSGLLFAIAMVLAFIGLCVYSNIFNETRKKFMLFVIPFDRMWEYVIGIFLGYIVRILLSNYEISSLKKVYYSIAEILCIVFAFFATHQDLEDWKAYDVSWVIPNALLLFVFGLGRGYISQLFKLKILNSLGEVTFECYLIHQLIIYVLAEIYGYESLGKWFNLFAIVIVYSLTIMFAFLLHKKGNISK